MWATSNDGEGMYTAYPFAAHHSYDIRIIFDPYANGNGSGSTFIMAANNIAPMTIDGSCGSPTPANENVQTIEEYTGTSAYQLDETYSFTANQAYSQIWIYPQGTSTSGTDELNLNVYSVYVCPSCTAILNYNTGTLPDGESTAGYINVGSTAGSGGSGTVTIQTGESTTLTAAQKITFLPSFQASVTGSGKFVAQIVACNNANTVQTESNPLDSVVVYDSTITINPDNLSRAKADSLLPATISAPASGSTRLQIYPTVSSGAFTITGSPADLNSANIIVVDASGRTVYSMYNAAGTTIPLDLGNLVNGLYFVQIRQQTKVTTQKIIISK
jgi:hypothetical protein